MNEVNNPATFIQQWGYIDRHKHTLGAVQPPAELYIKLRLGDLWITLMRPKTHGEKPCRLIFATGNDPESFPIRVRPGLLIRGEQGPAASEDNGMVYYTEPHLDFEVYGWISALYYGENKDPNAFIDWLIDNAHPVVSALLKCAVSQEKL
jgi:hypothetical protein